MQISVDPRRKVIIPGDYEKTLLFAVDDWIATANQAIEKKGQFIVALSGGSTPKAIYEELAKRKNALDWSKVFLFWSDERAVLKTDNDSNYKMAVEALEGLPVKFFPMDGVGDLEKNAKEYEKLVRYYLPFDLMMLGMGDDGHTASLFPKTHGLHAPGRDVIANFIPDKGIWRLSVTFGCINSSLKIMVYVLGGSKAEMIKRVFSKPIQGDLLPIQNVGTETHPAIYLLDDKAASLAFS